MRCLYLHGFASGPGSQKGVAFADYFGARGLAIERLDLRIPSLEHLRLSRMIAHVVEQIAGDDCVLIGSSLGGLTAARAAEQAPSVRALVLMAPAFQLVQRWRDRLGTGAWHDWQQTGWLAIHDHAERRPARVDFDFAIDALVHDPGWPAPRAPALVFHGTADDVVDVERSRRWIEEGPDRTLVELDDGHELVASLPAILPRAWDFVTGAGR